MHILGIYILLLNGVDSKYCHRKNGRNIWESKSSQQSIYRICLFPYHLFKEQQKIAEILTTVDEAIEKTAQIIEKTKEVKKGLMQNLLTRGIGHKKFKKTEIGEIPEEWECLIAKHMGKVPFGKDLDKVQWGSGMRQLMDQ